jgi:predicted AlkP superfamily pyrophosphatase or phosphodiesterase
MTPRVFIGFVSLFAWLSACFAERIPARERIVVVISIDGFPARMWKDPTLVIPNLRALAARGAVAEAMTVSNPSITWINHTTLVTGVNPRRHGVLFNGLLVRNEPTQPPKVEPWRDKAELVRVPTLYDAAFRAGLKTAQVDWVAILNSGTITHEFLEIPKPGGAIEQEMIAAGKVTLEDIRDFTKGKSIDWRDEMWTRAGMHIVETHKPNLLLFHLLTTDAANHQYSAGTLASRVAFAYADAQIGKLLAAIDRAGLRERATIAVVTDHGFKKVNKVIHANVALRDAGLIRMKGEQVESCDAYVVAEGGMAFAYITDPARRAELLPRVKEVCARVEGVGEVLDANEGPRFGMPTPAENQGMGDLILWAKAGYAFKDPANTAGTIVDPTNYLGTHGYAASDPELDGVFLIAGYGIKAGVRLERVANLDVAPTLAELLGVALPDVEGRVLREVLE